MMTLTEAGVVCGGVAAHRMATTIIIMMTDRMTMLVRASDSAVAVKVTQNSINQRAVCSPHLSH
jgi:hypothetical protein